MSKHLNDKERQKQGPLEFPFLPYIFPFAYPHNNNNNNHHGDLGFVFLLIFLLKISKALKH